MCPSASDNTVCLTHLFFPEKGCVFLMAAFGDIAKKPPCELCIIYKESLDF